jgi:hypothetical protein
MPVNFHQSKRGKINMSDRKRNVLDAAQRIDYFREANPDLKTELPYTVELFAKNTNCIERLIQSGITASAADGAGTSGTRSKAARFREIVADLRLTAKTARRMEKTVPNFVNSFTLPRGGGLTYDEALERADSFVADAPANAADFSKYALTAQFFTDLAADVAEFRDSWHQQADGKRTGVGATAEQEAAIEEMLENRAELDRVLKNHFRNDPVKLAEWLTASHIERRRRDNQNQPGGTPPPQT